jgi:hypothetical protein
VWYCSKKCQKDDWKTKHKHQCPSLSILSTAPDGSIRVYVKDTRSDAAMCFAGPDDSTVLSLKKAVATSFNMDLEKFRLVAHPLKGMLKLDALLRDFQLRDGSEVLVLHEADNPITVSVTVCGSNYGNQRELQCFRDDTVAQLKTACTAAFRMNPDIGFYLVDDDDNYMLKPDAPISSYCIDVDRPIGLIYDNGDPPSPSCLLKGSSSAEAGGASTSTNVSDHITAGPCTRARSRSLSSGLLIRRTKY